MIREILIWPNRRLKEMSAGVPDDELAEPELAQLVQDMFDTMYEARGVGLAAIQIGVPLRVFVMDTKRQVVLVNPRVVELMGQPEITNEGCLSLPGIIEMVPRHKFVRVAWTDLAGEGHEEVFQGMEAQCCQHEIEHLDGITIPDKLSPQERSRLVTRMKKAK